MSSTSRTSYRLDVPFATAMASAAAQRFSIENLLALVQSFGYTPSLNTIAPEVLARVGNVWNTQNAIVYVEIIDQQEWTCYVLDPHHERIMLWEARKD